MQKDFTQLTKEEQEQLKNKKIDVVFLSPPWVLFYILIIIYFCF